MSEEKGIKDLNVLLREMNAKLNEGEFVFCTISEKDLNSTALYPILTFREEEGFTIVIKKEIADQLSLLLRYSAVWRMITLQVHSDLTAVGFLARITNELAKSNISANVVSGYYHDHLFVPANRAEEALEILKNLTKS